MTTRTAQTEAPGATSEGETETGTFQEDPISYLKVWERSVHPGPDGFDEDGVEPHILRGLE